MYACSASVGWFCCWYKTLYILRSIDCSWCKLRNNITQSSTRCLHSLHFSQQNSYKLKTHHEPYSRQRNISPINIMIVHTLALLQLISVETVMLSIHVLFFRLGIRHNDTSILKIKTFLIIMKFYLFILLINQSEMSIGFVRCQPFRLSVFPYECNPFRFKKKKKNSVFMQRGKSVKTVSSFLKL